MKQLDPYRDPQRVRELSEEIQKITTQPWTLMEICGGQTHAIAKYGLESLLPPSITLIHGPGCPVCVTGVAWIDKAIEIAQTPQTTLCTFGDMIRVPGSSLDLQSAKGSGANVQIVYSPLDALQFAKANPEREIVFFAVGFETTAPTTAMAIYQASIENLRNISFLVSHVLVPPAMATLLRSPQNKINGFLAAGHVCTIMGFEEYDSLAQQFRVPIVITGFEPVDLLEGIYLCIQALEKGEYNVANQYARSVLKEGNPNARKMLEEVFERTPQIWRGLGSIDQSGLSLKEKYLGYDAVSKFGGLSSDSKSDSRCQAGLILQGQMNPKDCPEFGKTCKPESPLGAPMVSQEGACSAYYLYRRECHD